MPCKLVWSNPQQPQLLEELSDQELEAYFKQYPKPQLVDYMTTREHVERWFGPEATWRYRHGRNA